MEAYPVWIVHRGDHWEPRHWSDVPEQAPVIGLAAQGHFPQAQALALVQAFNFDQFHRTEHLWAVCVPVEVRYEGDLEPRGMFRAAATGRAAAGETPAPQGKWQEF